MSRVQLALNVADLEESVDFYAKLFGTQPTKREPGYANFAIADPPLKLVLIEGGSARGHGITAALNHLGVEVGTPDEVTAATGRLATKDSRRERRTPRRAAMRSRTRSGSVIPTARPGRSTRFSPMLRPGPASPVTGRAVHQRRPG